MMRAKLLNFPSWVSLRYCRRELFSQDSSSLGTASPRVPSFTSFIWNNNITDIRTMASAPTAAHINDSVFSSIKDQSLLKTGAFIGNEWVDAEDGARYKVENPATGETIAQVAKCGYQETDKAIKAAADAFKAWASRTAKDRASILRRWHNEILHAKDDIATIMTIECGKPLPESRNEFDSGIESITWFAEEAKRVCGDIVETPAKDKQFLVMKQPIGVVGAITPWNFPFSMITRKVSPALAAGCTVCLKPSELTPLTAMALAELGKRAGIPSGVLNIVSGNAVDIGKSLTDSKQVRKIAFTGSTRVGKLLYAASAGTVKRVSLELGGNAPYIVFDDADVNLAARDVVLSSYRNAGQTCICTNRVFVHESIYDSFNSALAQNVANLRVGDGLVPGVTHGPLISKIAVEQVDAKVQDAIQKGGKVLLGGSRPQFDDKELNTGFFYQPTVIIDAKQDMKVFKEEIFGPITPVFKFSTDAEVVRMANDTEYGLAAYFYTQNVSRVWHVAKALEYGMIGVNQVAITSEVAPFGGVKESGLGREHSKYGLDEFQDKKTVCLGLGKSTV